MFFQYFTFQMSSNEFFNHTSVEPMVINNFFWSKLFVDPSDLNDVFDFC